MQTILFSMGIFGVAILAMAVGVLFGRNKPIKGSCGGAATGDPDASCSVCGGSPEKCSSKSESDAQDDAPNPHYGALHKSLYQ